MFNKNTGSTIYPNKKKDNRLRTTHRLSILKNLGFYKKLPDNCNISRAITPNQLEKALRLVYKIFIQKGYIFKKPSGIKIRPHDTCSNNPTFIGLKESDIIAVCGIVIDSIDLGLPADKIFYKELSYLRANSRLICEATNGAISGLNKENGIFITEMLRCVIAYALYQNCDKIVICVNKCHKAFYKFNYFKQIGSLRSYSQNIYDPVIMLCLDLNYLLYLSSSIDRQSNPVDTFLIDYLYFKNPYLLLVELWSYMAQEQFKNIEKLISLFTKCPELFTEASQIELQAMENRLGLQAFDRLLTYQTASGF